VRRARSNGVTVDGADAVDNSVNGIRATVSQEAVQGIPVDPQQLQREYGRATGGVINIVTKGGGNEFHGDAFGFFRNKSFQARNPFSAKSIHYWRPEAGQAAVHPRPVRTHDRWPAEERQDFFLRLL